MRGREAAEQLLVCIKQMPRIRVYMFVLPKIPHFDVFCWQLTLFIKNKN
jgi:hypothetical protein